jgi:peroxiredoxin
VQLQQSLPALQARGLGVAAISYDPPAVLKTFAAARGIAFPLLSDAGSATIRAYDLLNAGATGEMAGIPHPGTFVLDRDGVVVSRSFEEKYQERATAGSLLGLDAQAPAAAKPTAETAHLTIRTSSSDGQVAPGSRLSLFIDVVPKPKMHVYAPEQKEYIPIRLTLEPADTFRAHPPKFPRAEQYFFAPLKETQLVFSKPFRIVQDVTVALTPAMRERARGSGASLTIAGTLRYQACDDAICYVPKEIPVSWTIGLRGLER